MNRRRYTIRTLLLIMAGCGTAFAAWHSFYGYHRSGAEREYEAIERYALDIYGFETESSLPNWLNNRLPTETRLDFEHITEIDLQFNNLSECDPNDVVDLHACKWVHTLRVPNATMSQEMFDAIMGFPNLRNLHVRDWFDRVSTHDVVLQPGVRAGVVIALE